MEVDQDSKEAMTPSTANQAVKEQPAEGLELHLERSDATVLNLATCDPVMGSGQPVSSVETESGKLSTLDEVLIATTCAGSTEAMTGFLQVHVSRGSDDNLLEGLDVWGIKPRKRKGPLNSKLTLGQPDAAATTSGPLVDLPVMSVAPTHLVNAVAIYGNSVAGREDLSGFQSAAQVREHQPNVNADRHLEQAQTSAQEATDGSAWHAPVTQENSVAPAKLVAHDCVVRDVNPGNEVGESERDQASVSQGGSCISMELFETPAKSGAFEGAHDMDEQRNRVANDLAMQLNS
jgi:hypothetical protein